MSLKKNLQDLCYSCHPDTVKARSRRLLSQLGIWVEIQSTNLSVARIQARLQWRSAAKSVVSYVKTDLSLLLKPASTLSRNLLRRGLLLLAAVSLLPVLVVLKTGKRPRFARAELPLPGKPAEALAQAVAFVEGVLAGGARFKRLEELPVLYHEGMDEL